jgi:hypothetical protein
MVVKVLCVALIATVNLSIMIMRGGNEKSGPGGRVGFSNSAKAPIARWSNSPMFPLFGNYLQKKLI